MIKLDNLILKEILFIDLDGTLINTRSGKQFPESIMDMEIKESVVKVLQYLTRKGSLKHIFIVTNQGGIENGHVSEDGIKAKLELVCQFLRDTLSYNTPSISFSYCSTNDKKNKLRKPNTGMLEDILDKNLDDSSFLFEGNMLFVGDASGKPGDHSDSDLKCAERFGIDYMDVDDFIQLCNN